MLLRVVSGSVNRSAHPQSCIHTLKPFTSMVEDGFSKSHKRFDSDEHVA
jgi:hypothetical protein